MMRLVGPTTVNLLREGLPTSLATWQPVQAPVLSSPRSLGRAPLIFNREELRASDSFPRAVSLVHSYEL